MDTPLTQPSAKPHSLALSRLPNLMRTLVACLPLLLRATRSEAAASDYFVSDDASQYVVYYGTSTNFSVLPGQSVALIGYSRVAEEVVPQTQWFFEGQSLPGATNQILSLPNVTAANAGRYSLQVISSDETNLIHARLILSSAAQFARVAQLQAIRTGEAFNAEYTRAHLGMDRDHFVYLFSTRFLPDDAGPAAVLSKFDTDGHLVWERIHRGPAGGAFAQGLAFSPEGSPVVTAMSFSGDETLGVTNSDFATLKYEATGTLVWSNRLSLDPMTAEQPRGLVVDEAGNTTVVGEIYPQLPDAKPSFMIVRYGTNGTELWRHSINFVALGGAPEKLQIAATASQVVFASSAGLLKLDSSGKEVWHLDTPCSAVALGSDGSVTATGSGTAFRVDAAGKTLWKISSSARQLAMTPDYGVVLAGTTLERIDATGQEVWTAGGIDTEGLGILGFDALEQVQLGADGSIYALGVTPWNGFSRALVLKVNPQGVTRWTSRFGGPVEPAQIPGSIVVDGDGHVWVSTLGADADPEASVSKYSLLRISPGNESKLPVISQLSRNVEASYGSTAQLQVAVSSSTPLELLWGHRQRLIRSSTGASLTIPSITFGTAGDYWLRAVNESGEVTSPRINLRFLGSALRIVRTNNPFFPDGFSITAFGQPLHVYQIEESTNLRDWSLIGTFTNSIDQTRGHEVPKNVPGALFRAYRLRDAGE